MNEPLRVFLRKEQTGEAVEAEVRTPISADDLLAWHRDWLPLVAEVLQKLHSEGIHPSKWPQTAHWNWARKVQGIQGLLGQETYSLWAENRLQGLMQLNLTKSCVLKEHAGKPLVYIDYLETAPWNRPPPFSGPNLGGVGSVLLAVATNKSIDEEFKGRIGLHSLPQSESFYVKHGLTDVGPDPNYEGLHYFETSAGA